MLTSNEHQLIADINNSLNFDFGAEFTDITDFDPDGFSLFSHYENYYVLNKIALKNTTKGYLSYIKLMYTSPGGKTGDIQHTEIQLWGSVKLNKNAGHILIRQENANDRLRELFYPVEIDIPEDKLFSKQFFCCC